jgi:hypothetical protein
MDSVIGRLLTAEEVKSFEDDTHIWIETNIPTRRVFVGVKDGNDICNLDGARKFSVIDIGSLCIAKEWLYKEPIRQEAPTKWYELNQCSLIEDEEEKLVIKKGTKVSSKYDIDENHGLRVTIQSGELKGREFLFSVVELDSIPDIVEG